MFHKERKSKLRAQEIITPRLTSTQQVDLMKALNQNVEIENRVYKTKSGREIKIANLPSLVPPHFISDLFNSYYCHEQDRKIEFSESARPKINALNKVADYGMNIVTGRSPASSYFFTEGTVQYLVSKLQRLMTEDPDQGCKVIQQMQNMANQGGQGDSAQNSKELNDFIDSLDHKELEEVQSEALKQAEHHEKQMSNMDKSSNPQADEKGQFSHEESNSFGKQLKSAATFKDIKKKLARMKVSKSDEFLKKVMKSNVGNFFDSEKTRHIPIMECEDLAGKPIIGLEEMQSPIYPLNVDDIVVVEKEKSGKSDLYIDSSGSMGSDHRSDSRILLAKSFALKLMQLELVRDVYFFDDTLHGPFNTPRQVLEFSSGGGTSFKVITDNCLKTKRRSLVLTDGQSGDNIPYLNNVFWLSIQAYSNFDCFRIGDKMKYIEKKRCGVFENSQVRVVK